MDQQEKITPIHLLAQKRTGRKITMLSIYDYATARLADRAGLDTILVGDSLATSILGYDNTAAVTLEEMLHHTRAVSRGARRAMVVADMPFMSYQISPQEAVRNAGRFVKEAGADAVKVEGGRVIAQTLKAIQDAGIPVVGHIGLTLQTATQLGGKNVQGNDTVAARRLLEDALILEEAGACVIILQCVPGEVARLITTKLQVPTISYGAGVHCDGQGLVSADMFGLSRDPLPLFAKCYVDIGSSMMDAITTYCTDVVAERFPDQTHTYQFDADVQKLTDALAAPIEGKL